jgi:hypothetical protein
MRPRFFKNCRATEEEEEEESLHSVKHHAMKTYGGVKV